MTLAKSEASPATKAEAPFIGIPAEVSQSAAFNRKREINEESNLASQPICNEARHAIIEMQWRKRKSAPAAAAG